MMSFDDQQKLQDNVDHNVCYIISFRLLYLWFVRTTGNSSAVRLDHTRT